MPRFCDQWLTDRVLFDYTMDGSCACCGMLFLPNGTTDLINAVSDLETDDARMEIQALDDNMSPWPEPLRRQVWADRVQLRYKLKQGSDMKAHATFWQQHASAFCTWCQQQSIQFWQRFFQLSRSELLQHIIRDRYNIHSAYSVVLSAICEQVAHFELTQYSVDGVGTAEVEFERALRFTRQCGFTLAGLVPVKDDSNGENECMTHTAADATLPADLLGMWLNRMKTLGGPKLLEKRGKAKTTRSRPTNPGGELGDNDDDVDSDDDGEDDVGDDQAPAKSRVSGGAGFASDRRIVRLLIGRYWAELLQKRFLADQQLTS